MHDGKIPIMVQERANWPKKIGRNELCPCGSGKSISVVMGDESIQKFVIIYYRVIY